jgi:hypothetical protein
MIVCIDTMEHLEDPTVYLKEFDIHLREEGYLLLKVDPTFRHTHPMHLNKNRLIFSNLDKIMEKIGFEQVTKLLWKKLASDGPLQYYC